MAFRNLSSSETGSQQFEVACNFETTLPVCFFSAGLTQQHAQWGKGVVDQTVLLCMEIRIGILVYLQTLDFTMEQYQMSSETRTLFSH